MSTTSAVDDIITVPASGPVPKIALPARTPEELAARAARLTRRLAEIDARPDDEPPGTDDEIMRAIDSARPHRPLFEGMP